LAFILDANWQNALNSWWAREVGSRPIGAHPQRQLAERANSWSDGEKLSPGQLALALSANWPRARLPSVGGNPNNLRDGLLTLASVLGIGTYLLGDGNRVTFSISIVLLLLISAQRLQVWRHDRRLPQR